MGKLENVGQMTHQPSTPSSPSETSICRPGIGVTNLTHMASQLNPSIDSNQAVVFPPPVQFLQSNPVYGHPPLEISHQNLTHITTPQASQVHGTGIYAQTQFQSPQYNNFLQCSPSDIQSGVPVGGQILRTASGANFQVVHRVPSTIYYGVPWETDLYDCLADPTNAAITMVAPCVTFGQIVELLDNGRTGCLLGGVVYGLSALVLCHWNIASMYRKRLRKIYNLVEAPMDDRCAHLIFPCCSLSQEYRELKRRGRDPSSGYQGKPAGNLQGREEGSNQAGIDDPPLRQMMTRCYKNLWP